LQHSSPGKKLSSHEKIVEKQRDREERHSADFAAKDQVGSDCISRDDCVVILLLHYSHVFYFYAFFYPC
jgi:hypothetical protein